MGANTDCFIKNTRSALHPPITLIPEPVKKMDKLMKRLNAVEIRISALRLEIVGIKDELNRLAEKNVDQNGEVFLELKLNLLAKKFELAKMRSERKLLELQVHHTGHQAA